MLKSARRLKSVNKLMYLAYFIIFVEWVVFAAGVAKFGF